MQLENISKLYQAAAKRLVSGPLGVNAVFLGKTSSGITSAIAEVLLNTEKTSISYEHAPAESKGYFDGAVHYLLAGKPRNRPDPGMTKSGRMVAKKRKPPRKWELIDIARELQQYEEFDAVRAFRDFRLNEYSVNWFDAEAD
ncbi:hypothetical protein LC612_31820 [Nostoc sp. CHAB 5834]|nr:hypothetical protein [Nostoc sp. CHAB 5834]